MSYTYLYVSLVPGIMIDGVERRNTINYLKIIINFSTQSVLFYFCKECLYIFLPVYQCDIRENEGL